VVSGACTDQLPLILLTALQRLSNGSAQHQLPLILLSLKKKQIALSADDLVLTKVPTLLYSRFIIPLLYFF
jgi:hypothetical protein